MKKMISFIALLCLGGFLFFHVQKDSCLRSSLLKVGVTTGPHALILEHVSKKAKEEDLTLEIIVFDDFILPNAALEQRDIQVNCYQHQPFLDEQIKSRHYKIHSVGKTVLMPMGIYSHKKKNLEEIPDNACIGIPNDPTNGGRALQLLQKVGLITLRDVPLPTPVDIQKNPKNIMIVELDAPRLPRSLDDLDCAVINTDWIFMASMDPDSALFVESPEFSPYTNLIVIHDDESNNPAIEKFVRLYQSEDTKAFIQNTFKGAILPGW